VLFHRDRFVRHWKMWALKSSVPLVRYNDSSHQQRELFMTAIAYNTIQPPFTLKFWDMSKKELRDYYNWFQEVIPERIDELASAVNSSNDFEDWKPDYGPSSLNTLGNWFATQVHYRPRTEEEMEEIAIQSPFPRSNEVMTNRTISLAMDIAMYFSQVLLRNHPSLRWEQPFGSKKYIDYGQPVLAGFADGVPMNPVRIITTLTSGLNDGTYSGKRLREIYDNAQKRTGRVE
jgi:hypothetical protein